MKQFRILAAALLLICMSAGLASAAGFAIYEWSARGNALGGTMVARADDPSAVAFNPAGITQLEGTHFQGGMSAIMPQAEITVTNP